MIKAGLDTRSGPIEDWNGGKTGYYLRKYVDPTVDPQYVKQDVPFKHIRYGEILLDYAEACIELGQDAEARTYINMIRTRAGQPNLPALTGDALRQAYRHERRVELAFEDHRFWDVRRWFIGERCLQADICSRCSLQYNKHCSCMLTENLTVQPGAPLFSLRKTLLVMQELLIRKYYFFPILRAEMNKNTKLIQNPGY